MLIALVNPQGHNGRFGTKWTARPTYNRGVELLGGTKMFGLPFGGGGGILGALLSYGFFFFINLVIQFFTGGLSDLFPTEMMAQ